MNGLYQVSNLGKVKSLNRIAKSKNESIKHIQGKELKINCDKMGYPIVMLSKEGKRETKRVHKLVAKAFIKNPNNYTMINHIDGNKTNNNVNNLEWCTQKHNIQQAYLLGLSKRRLGKQNVLSKTVNQYSLDGEFIKQWECTMQVERELGLNNKLISNCCRGNTNKAYGYIWRYVDE